MKRIASFLCVVSLMLIVGVFSSGCASAPPFATPLSRKAIPPTVAVSSFENISGFDEEWSIGEGMADLLVSELVSSKNFEVVEREHLEVLMEELERQKDKAFRAEGKVDLGRLKNVRYMIRGVINDFSQVSGGGLSLFFKTIMFLGKGCTARVSMTLTIVDVETGEIIDSVQCSGNASASERYISAEYKGVTFGGDRFFKTPLGVATAHAMRRGLRGLTHKMPKTYWEPLIAAVNKNNYIVINGGRDRSVKIGSMYDVRGAGRPVTDPSTGDLLDIIPGPIVGTIKIVEVNEGISYAQIVSGSDFQRGQRLRKK